MLIGILLLALLHELTLIWLVVQQRRYTCDRIEWHDRLADQRAATALAMRGAEEAQHQAIYWQRRAAIYRREANQDTSKFN